MTKDSTSCEDQDRDLVTCKSQIFVEFWADSVPKSLQSTSSLRAEKWCKCRRNQIQLASSI